MTQPDVHGAVMVEQLPIIGEASPALWEAAHGGQAVILTRDGAPALVVLDVDSFAEWAQATGTAP